MCPRGIYNSTKPKKTHPLSSLGGDMVLPRKWNIPLYTYLYRKWIYNIYIRHDKIRNPKKKNNNFQHISNNIIIGNSPTSYFHGQISRKIIILNIQQHIQPTFARLISSIWLVSRGSTVLPLPLDLPKRHGKTLQFVHSLHKTQHLQNL